MKKQLFLLAAMLAFACSLHCAETPSSNAPSSQEANQPFGEIDTNGLKALINSGVPVVILDTRASLYDDGKRVPGALLTPYNSAPEQLVQNIPSQQSLIVVYCTSSHCPLSKITATKLIQLGYTNVIKYTAGIEGWISSGNKYDNVKTAPK